MATNAAPAASTRVATTAARLLVAGTASAIARSNSDPAMARARPRCVEKRVWACASGHSFKEADVENTATRITTRATDPAPRVLLTAAERIRRRGAGRCLDRSELRRADLLLLRTEGEHATRHHRRPRLKLPTDVAQQSIDVAVAIGIAIRGAMTRLIAQRIGPQLAAWRSARKCRIRGAHVNDAAVEGREVDRQPHHAVANLGTGSRLSLGDAGRTKHNQSDSSKSLNQSSKFHLQPPTLCDRAVPGGGQPGPQLDLHDAAIPHRTGTAMPYRAPSSPTTVSSGGPACGSSRGMFRGRPRSPQAERPRRTGGASFESRRVRADCEAGRPHATKNVPTPDRRWPADRREAATPLDSVAPARRSARCRNPRRFPCRSRPECASRTRRAAARSRSRDRCRPSLSGHRARRFCGRIALTGIRAHVAAATRDPCSGQSPPSRRSTGRRGPHAAARHSRRSSRGRAPRTCVPHHRSAPKTTPAIHARATATRLDGHRTEVCATHLTPSTGPLARPHSWAHHIRLYSP